MSSPRSFDPARSSPRGVPVTKGSRTLVTGWDLVRRFDIPFLGSGGVCTGRGRPSPRAARLLVIDVSGKRSAGSPLTFSYLGYRERSGDLREAGLRPAFP